MEDWESEDWQPEPLTVATEKIKGKWDDEDEDTEDVRESWEDEGPESKDKKPAASAEKTTSKGAGKKGKGIEPEKAADPLAAADERLTDPLAEKLRQQRLVEEADLKSTVELFGQTGDEKSLNHFIPKSEQDFADYAELVSQKLRPYEKSFHYVNLLKNVMRLSMAQLKAAEAKEISSSITAIMNEKLKAEKEATTKKKPIAKKKQLHVDKANDDAIVDRYDGIDDYDFM